MTTSAAPMDNRAALARQLSTENLKWLGATCMLFDHINKYLFAGNVPWMFDLGRLAFPLFVAALACNLARCSKAARIRTVRRLAITASVSTAPYCWLGRELLIAAWWPLCVMWTLLLITLTIEALSSTSSWVRSLGLASAAVAAGFVEFWWPGVGLGVGLWLLFSQRCGQVLSASIVAASMAGLCVVNGNAWALAAAPAALGASMFRDAPRIPWLFYTFYPVHLLALGVVRSSLM